MPRPRICRRVRCEPGFNYFKPRGVPMSELQTITLAVDEFEAIRLTDLEDLEQTAGAEKMQISQPTFHRTLESARKKVADALINGKAIKIEGGDYKATFAAGYRCRGYGHGFRGLHGVEKRENFSESQAPPQVASRWFENRGGG